MLLRTAARADIAGWLLPLVGEPEWAGTGRDAAVLECAPTGKGNVATHAVYLYEECLLD